MSFQHTKTPFVQDTFYHIYNRGINKEKIFFKEENYIFFLEKFNKYLDELVDTYAYCLIPNHFHLLIKVKSELELKPIVNVLQIDNKITESFRIMLMGYAKAINKQETREGSLFKRNIKIKPVVHDNHLLSLTAYIHTNPNHHKVIDTFENYKWSSYQSILSNKPTKLKRNELLEIFEGKENFIQYHRSYKDYTTIREFVEDENG